MSPAAKRIGPGLDRVFISRIFVKRARAAPTVVIDMCHGGLVPVGGADNSPLQDGRHEIVPILEDISLNRQIFADDTLDWITAAIDQRPKILDNGGRKSP
jgi:hypothetical protein